MRIALGVSLALALTGGVTVRAGVQIIDSGAYLDAIASTYNFSCTNNIDLEAISSHSLACDPIGHASSAQTNMQLSLLNSPDNSNITLRLSNEAHVSGYDPDVYGRYLYAFGTGGAFLDVEVTDEPMLVTVTIKELETNSGFAGSIMHAQWRAAGPDGIADSIRGTRSEKGVFEGILNPGDQMSVSLDIEYSGAFIAVAEGQLISMPSAFARGEITLKFEPAICAQPASAAGTTAGNEIISWDNPSGGSYSQAGNWDPEQVPNGSCGTGDTAVFELPAQSPILINAQNATAGSWRVRNGRYEINGPARLFSSSTTDVSLEVSHNGQVELGGSDLFTRHSRIGEALGSTPGTMIVPHAGAYWENEGRITMSNGVLTVFGGAGVQTEELVIGSVPGRSATASVTGVFGDSVSTIEADRSVTVGSGGTGMLSILDGAMVGTRTTDIGLSGMGTVVIAGSADPDDPEDSTKYAQLIAEGSLHVGGVGVGTLRVERGGAAMGNPVIVAPVGSGSSRMIVDGQGAFALVNAATYLSVHGGSQVEVEAIHGGRIVAESIRIGGGTLPLSADVTVRGDATQTDPTYQSYISTADLNPTFGGAGIVSVGAYGPGQLNITAGAQGQFRAGMVVGGGAQGIVLINGQGAPENQNSQIQVTGVTEIGVGAPGTLQIGDGAAMQTVGDVRVGSGAEGSVMLGGATSTLNVNGTLSVGRGGIGSITATGGSAVHVDTLNLGGTANGFFTLNYSFLNVRGNANVGQGHIGELQLNGSISTFTIDGTLTIGSLAGQPGVGLVGLSGGAVLRGAGNVVINPKGFLVGSGSVELCSVCVVNNGGTISPGLSPGTLTIIGSYEQTFDGRLEIEYAGLNPGEFDVLHVTGPVTLGGHLEIQFVSGFSPPDPQGFLDSQDFVEAESGVNGDYDRRTYAYPDFFADFDEDGDKDLFDVGVFQNCVGVTDEDLIPDCARADWENDGLLGGREVQELTRRLGGPQ